MADSRVSSSEPKQTLEIVITLLDVGVDVDQRVSLPSDAFLAALHLITQVAMGWENYHLHEFKSRRGTVYGDASLDDDGWGGPRVVDESRVRLTEVLASRAMCSDTSTTSATPDCTGSNWSPFTLMTGREPEVLLTSTDTGHVRPRIAEARGVTEMASNTGGQTGTGGG